MFKLHILPENRSIDVSDGQSVYEACQSAGIFIQSACGGGGTCNKCTVRFLSEDIPVTERDREHFSKVELSKGYRFSCGIMLHADTSVEISKQECNTGDRILTSFQGPKLFSGLPLVRQYYKRVKPPVKDDGVGDFERLKHALGPPGRGLCINTSTLQNLQSVMRKSAFEVTATCAGRRLLAVEGGDQRKTAWGMAFDIGTTTVVGYMLDLTEGRELAVASRPNPQASLGQDVIARAQYADKNENACHELQSLIVNCLQAISQECAEKASVPLERCFDVVISGNTIMLHLLLGVNPHCITVVPFSPAWTGAREFNATALGFSFHPEARVYLLPCVAGYIGGDVTAGLLATGIYESEELVLFVDVGTNGEVALGDRDGWLVCAAPAGPAFEGARISCGMIAMGGAIDAVSYSHETGDLNIHVLGETSARGLCGTGLIDSVATFLETGLIDEVGRIVAPNALPDHLSQKLTGRVSTGKNGLQINLVQTGQAGEDQKCLSLTQRDIRELQLAKGTIRSAVEMALKIRGVTADKVKRVLIAGGFGSYIRPKSARAIGLFPDAFLEESMEFVGNTAGLGAILCLAHLEARSRVERIAKQMTYIDLASQPGFTEVFSDAMLFPSP